MTNQQAAPAAASKRNWAIAFALSCYLIAEFLWRTFTPAHEHPMDRTPDVHTQVNPQCY